MLLLNTILFSYSKIVHSEQSIYLLKCSEWLFFPPERVQTRAEAKPWEQVLYLIHPAQLADVLFEFILLCNGDTKSYFYTTRFPIWITNIMYMNMLNGRVGSFKYHKWQQMEHHRKLYFMVCTGALRRRPLTGIKM